MKPLLITAALLALSFLFWYCKPTKFNTDNLPARQLRWGSGGGFTGKETSFCLLENGQIFRFAGVNGEKSETTGTKSRTAKGLFESAATLELAKITFNHPGNMYYFIEVPGEGDKPLRITWGDDRAGQPVEQKVKDFYTVLQQLVLSGAK